MTKPNGLSDPALDAEVAALIQNCIGQANAIKTRTIVHAIFGEWDTVNANKNDFPTRKVRSSIERLREGLMMICNVGDGDGYFIAETLEEYKAFKSYYLGQASRRHEIIRGLDVVADEKWGKAPKPTPSGQFVMFDEVRGSL